MNYAEYLNLQKEYSQQATQEFETQLNTLGLTIDSLNILDSKGIAEKLTKINEVVSDTGKYNFRDLSFDHPNFNSIEGKNEIVKFTFEVKPYLNERKNFIIDLLKVRSTKGNLSKLEEYASAIDDTPLRNNIESLIKESFKSLDLDHQKVKVNAISVEDQLKIFDKKSQFYIRLLNKETTASLIGSFIIVLFAVVLVICLVKGIKMENTLIGNAFWILLGYFFGQTHLKSRNN